MCKKQSLILRFQITGRLRYLSHQQTADMFSRVLIQSDVPLVFSSGFNPRPLISLPLPRSVGQASEDELLCVVVDADIKALDRDILQDIINLNLPDQCRIFRTELTVGAVKPKPEFVNYIYDLINVPEDICISERVEHLRTSISEGDQITVRRYNKKKGSAVTKDITSFLISVDLIDKQLSVRAAVSRDGTMRVDDITQLLGIKSEGLSIPVTRKSVEWESWQN